MAIVRVCMLFAAVSTVAFCELINGRFPYYILEELSANTLIGNVAIDAKLSEKYDTETYRALTFSFLNQGSDDRSNLFNINNDSSIISTAIKLDRDSICEGSANCYVPLDVAVGPAKYFEVIKIIMEVIDINDHSPSFGEDEYVFNVSESARVGTVLSLPLAQDADSLQYSVKSYELVPQNDLFLLRIETDRHDIISDLQLVTLGSLDHEHTDIYQLKLVVYDGGDPIKIGQTILSIRVLDSNDNSPQFENRRYEVFVSETVELETVVAIVTAHDNDAGDYGLVTYSFSPQTKINYGDIFDINNVTGEIFVIGSLDFESQNIYILEITARDHGRDVKTTTASVTVRIMDVNDWAPTVSINTLNSEGVGRIIESAALGSFVASISVIDQDGGRNGQTTCTINDPTFAIVKLKEGQFKIVSDKPLDRESKALYNLEIKCSDFGIPSLSSAVLLRVEISDANDVKPQFDQPVYEIHVLENNEIGEEFLTVHASDQDNDANGHVVYEIESNYQEMFGIDLNEGVIHANTVLDRERMERVTFRVFAYDLGVPRQTGTASVRVIVDDINDTPPVFYKPDVAMGIFENEPLGSRVGNITAIDKDTAPNNMFYYDMPPTEHVPFDIDSQTGVIITTGYLDRETQSVYYFTVLAVSNILPPMTSSASVTVYVADRNDQTPVFTWPTDGDNTIHIAPNTPRRTVIAHLLATDADIGDNAKLEYSLESNAYSEYFEVHIATGAVTILKLLQNIEEDTVSVRVKVKDWGPPSLSSSSILSIVINQTLSYIPDSSDTDTESEIVSRDEAEVIILNNNKIIIISLSSVGLLLLFAIILAVILIKRMTSDRSRDSESTCGSDRPLPIFRSGESNPEFS